MFNKLKMFILNVVPVLLLIVVVVASFKLVSTDRTFSITVSEHDAAHSFLPTPVAPQAVLIQANSPPEYIVPSDSILPVEAIASAEGTGLDKFRFDKGSSGEPTGDQNSSVEDKGTAKKEQVWEEITEAISGLNDLVGAEMFLDVRRMQKGQLEIGLDADLWKRVRYQTRVNLKTDISNLWHLYVTEYGQEGSSVVYFMNESDGKVIDIFSKAN